MAFDDFVEVMTPEEVPVTDGEALEWVNRKLAERGLAPRTRL